MSGAAQGWPIYRDSIEVKAGQKIVITAAEDGVDATRADVPRLPVSNPTFVEARPSPDPVSICPAVRQAGRACLLGAGAALPAWRLCRRGHAASVLEAVSAPLPAPLGWQGCPEGCGWGPAQQPQGHEWRAARQRLRGRRCASLGTPCLWGGTWSTAQTCPPCTWRCGQPVGAAMVAPCLLQVARPANLACLLPCCLVPVASSHLAVVLSSHCPPRLWPICVDVEQDSLSAGRPCRWRRWLGRTWCAPRRTTRCWRAC